MIELKKLEQADLEYRVLLLNNDEIAPYINVAEKFTLTIQDCGKIVENDNDELITELFNKIPFNNTFSILNSDNYFDHVNIENDSTRQDFVFMNKGQKVGMGGLSNISITDKNCELYMYMDINYQGKGLGFLSGKKLCEYAFNILKLEKVFLYTFSDNHRANSLYEKIGFKLEGVLRKHTYKSGCLQDRNIYGLLKNEIK